MLRWFLSVILVAALSGAGAALGPSLHSLYLAGTLLAERQRYT